MPKSQGLIYENRFCPVIICLNNDNDQKNKDCPFS